MYPTITHELAQIHLQELHREAEANRLAALAIKPGRALDLRRRLVNFLKVDAAVVTRQAVIEKA